MRRYIVIVVLAVVFASTVAVRAQLVVHDSANTLRNGITAAIKELLVTTQVEQHSQLRRMAHRLSRFTNLDKYALPEVPRWRTHDFENPEAFLYARAYHAALNYGDGSGGAYLGVSHPVLHNVTIPSRVAGDARRAFIARLATIDAADAVAIATTHDTGQLRFNGRQELRAIDVLERHVIDPSDEQSATAVLGKISGAVLIGARQRQARTQLLTGVVEQLVIDSKRARDAEAAAMNMQIVALRDRRAANEAFVAGTGDALRTWRQQ